MQPVSLNKLSPRHWQLLMPGGEPDKQPVLEMVVQAHTVQLTLDGVHAGSLLFRALSSANSDAAPLYRLDQVEIKLAGLSAMRDQLVDTALQLFSLCTGAKVIISKRLV